MGAGRSSLSRVHFCTSVFWLCFGFGSGNSDGPAGTAAPFGPGAGVDLDIAVAKQVAEYEPRGGGASAQGGVGDDGRVFPEIGGREDGAQIFNRSERTVVVVEADQGSVERRGHVPSAPAGFHTTAGPERFPPVLRCGAHIK